MRPYNRILARPPSLMLLAAVVSFLIYGSASAATGYVVDIDRNFFVRAIDWVEDGSKTRVLVLTYPGTDQPHIREGCTANFYSLELRSGLENSQLVPVAANYCGHRLDQSGRILENGDALFFVDDRVETFRPGTGRIGSWSFSDVAELQRHPPSVTRDVRHIDAYSDGSIVFASGFPAARGDFDTPSAVVAGLSQEGELRWEYILAERGIRLVVTDVWATADGGALLHVLARPMRGAEVPEGTASSENRLYRISAAGGISTPLVIASTPRWTGPAELPDMTTDPEGYRAAINAAVEASVSTTYTDGQLVGHAGPDGSVDLLLGVGTREVRVVRIDARGDAVLDRTLTEEIQTKDRHRWQDGFIKGDVVTIFGTLGLKETRLPQGYASSLDLSSQQLTTRLAPLEGPGLEAAIQARDAERRFLEHDPAQQAQLLARLGGKPLLISLIKRNRLQALQLTEVDDSLQSYPPVSTEPPALSATDSPPDEFTRCDCSCGTLSSMQRRSDYLKAESKATGQPPPVTEVMRMSQCFVRCQQAMMACMQQR